MNELREQFDQEQQTPEPSQEDKKQQQRENIRNFLLNYSLYIVLGILILIIIILEPSFLSLQNLTNILSQASTRAIMALGAAGLIVLQGTDLSAGRVLGLAAVVGASLLQDPDFPSRMYAGLPQLPIFIPLLVTLAIGAIFGLINGFGVAVLRVHAFIITLGTQLIAYGLSLIYIDRPPLGAQPIGSLDSRYTSIVRGSFSLGIFKLPYLVIYAAIISIIMWIVWNKTRLGKNMFAIGGNMEAAEVSGVKVVKNIMIVFLISGLLYGLAGYLEAARIGSVTSNTGLNYDLDAISASVIGGVSFSGGVGTIPGVLIGTLILQVINYGLTFVGVNPYLQYIIRGLIIIIAVSLDVRKYIKRK